MRTRRGFPLAEITWVLAIGIAAATSFAGQPLLDVKIAVWDTAQSSSNPLAASDFQNLPQWRRVARGKKIDAFQGDAVLTGGRVMLVLRQGAAAAELYSVGPAGVVLRARLQLLTRSGQLTSHLKKLAIVEHTRGAARVEATYVTDQGMQLSAQFRVKRGDVAVELRPGKEAGRLRVHCAGRFAILPDFFADDIVLDARTIPASTIEMPSENFLLQPTGSQDVIVASVFENRDQEVRVLLEGHGDSREIVAAEIEFGHQRDGGKIWVAAMSAPRIWHLRQVSRQQAGKVIPLDWHAPFPAQWRIDFTCADGLTDSWEMLLPDPDGKRYLKPTWLGQGASHIQADRKRWTTVLGWFSYPFWTDHDGHVYVQPLKHRILTFEGPAIVYPIHRLANTPSDQFTVVDVVRNTLGVGPCEYILDVEGQKQDYLGRATCAARDALMAIYRQGRQKVRREEIDRALNDALAFVTHIRGRITKYVEFSRAMRQYLAQQKKGHPELTDFLNEMDQIAGQIDQKLAARREKIKTPQVVAEMNERFRRELLDADAPDTVDKVKQYTKALTRIGGNQDELVGECRWVTKILRQRAGMRMATDPRCAAIANEIRARCRKVMLKPATYEAARH